MGEFRSPSSGRVRGRMLLAAVVCAVCWNGSGAAAVEEEPPAATDPASFFSLLGLGPDWWQEPGHAPQLPPSPSAVARIVAAMQKIPPGSWELWGRAAAQRRPHEPLPRRADRAIVVESTGRVRGLRKWTIPAEVQSRYEMGPMWDVEIERPSQSEQPWHLLTPVVPHAWTRHSPAGQRVRVRGLWLGRDETGGGWIIGPRIIWIPDRPSPVFGVTAEQVRLATAGFDLGQLDAVRRTDKKPVEVEDREAFWEMLRAARRLRGKPLSGGVHVESVATLLTRSGDMTGRAVRLKGSIRRVTRVEITNPIDRRRLGFDHYFQLDMFADLGDTAIRIRGGSKEGVRTEPRTLTGFYPVTLCMVDLPEPLARRVSDGKIDKIHWGVTVEGFFYKSWRYHSDFIAAFGEEARQVVPLVMPTAIRELGQPQENRTIATALAIAMALLVAAALVAIVWIRRRETPWKERLRAHRRDGEERRNPEEDAE